MEILIELLAEKQHEIWAHWMKYLFSCCETTPDGDIIIPGDKAFRWKRQMETPYIALSEQEKESDRHQAEKIISALKTVMVKDKHWRFNFEYILNQTAYIKDEKE